MPLLTSSGVVGSRRSSTITSCRGCARHASRDRNVDHNDGRPIVGITMSYSAMAGEGLFTGRQEGRVASYGERWHDEQVDGARAEAFESICRTVDHGSSGRVETGVDDHGYPGVLAECIERLREWRSAAAIARLDSCSPIDVYGRGDSIPPLRMHVVNEQHEGAGNHTV